MTIEWTDKEFKRGREAWQNESPTPPHDGVVRAIMSRAVELYLARASGQVKEDVELVRRCMGIFVSREMDAEGAALSRLSALANEVGTLRAEVERLKDDLENAREDVVTNQRVIAEEVEKRMAAESRLAAIREILLKVRKSPRNETPADTAEEAARDRGFGDGWVTRGATMRAELDALEAAPNSPGIPEGSPNDSMPSNGSVVGLTAHDFAAMSDVPLYPCSATCTHDDAATPGHPERVKEGSEAMWRIVAPDAPGDVPDRADDDNTAAESDAYDRGAEAMRAACWEAVHRVCDLEGLGEHMTEHFKSVIVGATT
jgi:hypothetical protein